MDVFGLRQNVIGEYGSQQVILEIYFAIAGGEVKPMTCPPPYCAR